MDIRLAGPVTPRITVHLVIDGHGEGETWLVHKFEPFTLRVKIL